MTKVVQTCELHHAYDAITLFPAGEDASLLAPTVGIVQRSPTGLLNVALKR